MTEALWFFLGALLYFAGTVCVSRIIRDHWAYQEGEGDSISIDFRPEEDDGEISPAANSTNHVCYTLHAALEDFGYRLRLGQLIVNALKARDNYIDEQDIAFTENNDLAEAIEAYKKKML